MHQNVSHIYVGEGGRTSVWRALWGGGGEPYVAEEVGVEAVAEGTGVDGGRRDRRTECGADRRELRVLR
jgi:hypothetical protein